MPQIRKEMKKTYNWTDEDFALVYDAIYAARMQQACTPIPQEAGTYTRQSITPSMLKGHQRVQENERILED